MTPAPPAEVSTSSTKPHLDSVDVVRVLTVALVIAVHVVSQQPGGIGVVNGAALIVMHVSRQVFFMVTTFVLVYMYRDRPPRWSVFWRRRYLLVGVPYLVWSAVYFVADGHRLWPIGPALLGFAHDVAMGTARYHLYFLLVTMQVYLVFPLLLWLMRVARRWHGRLVAVSLAYELAVYAAIEHDASLGVLRGWVRNPGPFLPTYLGFVVIGAVAACHTDGLLAWTRARARWIYVGTGLATTAGVVILLIQVLFVGQPAWSVSSVFQPVVVIESLAIAWTYLALGLAWQHHGAPKGPLVRVAAEASFGVYLAHPLLLQGLLLLSADTGLSAVAQRAPGALVTAVSVVVVVPLIYVTCTVFAELVRRTPLSLPLTGRARRRIPEPVPCPPQESARPGTSVQLPATRGATKRRGNRRRRRRRRHTQRSAGRSRRRSRRPRTATPRFHRPSGRAGRCAAAPAIGRRIGRHRRITSTTGVREDQFPRVAEPAEVAQVLGAPARGRPASRPTGARSRFSGTRASCRRRTCSGPWQTTIESRAHHLQESRLTPRK